MTGGTHAVVIGGSLAGLCAARVLADHFEQVTVLDRDRFPTDAQHRKGVPQSRHPHAMLDAGRRQLERLFPGFDRTVLERGGLDLNPGLDMAFLRAAGGWGRRRKSPVTLLFASRILIESVIRELARKLENVRVLEETDVTGLLVQKEGGLRATGVAVRGADGAETELEADLVVDASGRSTRLPEWLEKLALPPIETDVVDARAGYSSRWYQGPRGADRPADWWWRCLWVEPLADPTLNPEEQFFGVLFPCENDTWVVTTCSWGGEKLARDPETFEHMISRLRTPVLAEAIALAEPISPVYASRSMQNTWRHYERWSGELAGFIATGDAVCGFNPVYGQGMSSASRCAGVLERCLQREDPRAPAFPKRFFREQARFLRSPWMMAVSRDRQQARLEGDDGGAALRVGQWLRRLAAVYMQQVALAIPRDEKIGIALFEVANLSAEPPTLFRPAIVARTMRARLRQRLRPDQLDAEALADQPPAAIRD